MVSPECIRRRQDMSLRIRSGWWARCSLEMASPAMAKAAAATERIGPELTEADRQLIDQRLERFLTDSDPGLDADEVLEILEKSL